MFKRCSSSRENKSSYQMNGMKTINGKMVKFISVRLNKKNVNNLRTKIIRQKRCTGEVHNTQCQTTKCCHY